MPGRYEGGRKWDQKARNYLADAPKEPLQKPATGVPWWKPILAGWKRVIDHALRLQTNERQAAEVAIAVDLNRMLEQGRPSYVRIA